MGYRFDVQVARLEKWLRGPGMTALLRAELLKLRTTRTFAALVGTALGVSLVAAVLIAATGSAVNDHDARNAHHPR